MKFLGVRYSAVSPTRVDLAGGTLDLWPFYSFLGGAKTLNVPITIRTKADVVIRDDLKISITSPDIKLQKTWDNLSAFMADQDPGLLFFQCLIDSVKPSFGFDLYSQSESPVGGGLGGSSSLTMSLLKAFQQAQKKKSQDWELITWASNIEAQVLRKPTGTQDYVPALYSQGVNAIHYNHNSVFVETLKIRAEDFHSRFSLVYTGRSHNSGINNWDVQKKLIDGDKKMDRALHRLAEISQEMYSLLKAPTKKTWDEELPELFRKETEARTELSEGFSSPEIKLLNEIVLRAGGHAVKICGAGGGGCAMLWSPPDSKEKVEQACRSVSQLQVLKAEAIL